MNMTENYPRAKWWRALRIPTGHSAVVAAVAASCSMVGCADTPHTILETQSPGGRYSARLFGRPGDSPLFRKNRVYLNARRGSVPLVQREEVHYAGFLDSGFDNSFDPAVWSAENVLWLPTNRGRRTPTRDELWVENQLSESIEFLQINTRDLFFIFDLSPRVRCRLEATAFRATADVSWVLVKGVVKGKRLLLRQASFELKGPRATKDRYDILISASGVETRHRIVE